jgi:hypothetical protein
VATDPERRRPGFYPDSTSGKWKKEKITLKVSGFRCEGKSLVIVPLEAYKEIIGMR